MDPNTPNATDNARHVPRFTSHGHHTQYVPEEPATTISLEERVRLNESALDAFKEVTSALHGGIGDPSTSGAGGSGGGGDQGAAGADGDDGGADGGDDDGGAGEGSGEEGGGDDSNEDHWRRGAGAAEAPAIAAAGDDASSTRSARHDAPSTAGSAVPATTAPGRTYINIMDINLNRFPPEIRLLLEIERRNIPTGVDEPPWDFICLIVRFELSGDRALSNIPYAGRRLFEHEQTVWDEPQYDDNGNFMGFISYEINPLGSDVTDDEAKLLMTLESLIDEEDAPQHIIEAERVRQLVIAKYTARYKFTTSRRRHALRAKKGRQTGRRWLTFWPRWWKEQKVYWGDLFEDPENMTGAHLWELFWGNVINFIEWVGLMIYLYWWFLLVTAAVIPVWVKVNYESAAFTMLFASALTGQYEQYLKVRDRLASNRSPRPIRHFLYTTKIQESEAATQASEEDIERAREVLEMSNETVEPIRLEEQPDELRDVGDISAEASGWNFSGAVEAGERTRDDEVAEASTSGPRL
ncbi:hypothetical protein CALCODRAFT_482713 [Calocera cornea HHB12733]|uniref:Uncharacterized protein n=1 Tax=Calocera cornea HHB12733 TaxID=1353952 RepID=A0A165GFS1_9BASI|nr:hypothetical protein CALCODRAFT_482713 [Calocera cornea HHB12733]